MKTLTYIIVTILLGSSQLVFGWNKPGHMVTGAIAYQVLQQIDPMQLKNAVALLKQHPDYPKWKRQMDAEFVEAKDEGLFLFMHAARWPDDIRGTSLHCELCHYINYPYSQDGTPTSPEQPTNVESALAENLAKLTSQGTVQSKAQAFCWVAHLVGDIHQPLHSTAFFSQQFPQGDRGGTRYYIRPTAGAKTIHLHHYWDALVTGDDRSADEFANVKERANSLLGAYQRSNLTELSERNPHEWAKTESFNLAVNEAYRKGKVKAGSASNGQVLPDDYEEKVTPIAERRAVLAGYRLAEIIKANVPATRIRPERRILSPVEYHTHRTSGR